ncbi:Putative oxidoreductase of aldo/keto reductase family (fragment) [Candidatus Desulfosporosinus infrequens]|uniref:Oxidoreductase of aldo/keto reductase family n=1 Tax=Candidatus Desulfosporosinus infrequens TaxID=2043169 RepID=A0A2U3LGC5_9FIRM
MDYIDEVLSFYEQPNIVTEEDNALMEKYRKDLGSQFCRRCEYCQPCPNGVMITPAMGYPILAKRMSPEVSVIFAKNPMESVTECIGCGECITRCPYDLPIPDILQRNYGMYIEHKNLNK